MDKTVWKLGEKRQSIEVLGTPNTPVSVKWRQLYETKHQPSENHRALGEKYTNTNQNSKQS